MNTITVHTLCDEMKNLSIETWERIGFARSRPGLKIYETTITQNLLFELKKFSERHKITQIDMFEATNEKTNGNDLEIFLRVGSKYLCLPTQAKIIYGNGKYPRMEHGNQINDLMSYSSSIGGYPLYLLYNYDSANDPVFNRYGCSIVSAQYLVNNYAHKVIGRKGAKWIIPSFSDLHPSIAEPWSVLACDVVEKLNDLFLTTLNPSLIPESVENIKEYTSEEVLQNTQWQKMSFSKGLAEADTDTDKDTIYDENTDGFAPKFRIVFSSKEEGEY